MKYLKWNPCILPSLRSLLAGNKMMEFVIMSRNCKKYSPICMYFFSPFLTLRFWNVQIRIFLPFLSLFFLTNFNEFQMMPEQPTLTYFPLSVFKKQGILQRAFRKRVPAPRPRVSVSEIHHASRGTPPIWSRGERKTRWMLITVRQMHTVERLRFRV